MMNNMIKDFIGVCKENRTDLDEREKSCYLDIIEKAFRIFVALFIFYQFIILRIFNNLDLEMESKLDFYINDLANVYILFIGILSYYIAFSLIRAYVNVHKVIAYAIVGSAFISIFISSFFEDSFSWLVVAVVTVIAGLILYTFLDLLYKNKMNW